MSTPAVRLAWLLSMLAPVLACGTKQPDEAPNTDAKSDAKAETTPDKQPETKPEPSTDPTVDAPPSKQAEVALTLRLQPAAADSLTGFEFTAEPAPQAEPLAGLRSWSCTDTHTVPPPCGWAKLCADLGRRWATQIGAGEVADQLGDAEYQEDCGDDGDVPYESASGDFVDHAAVIRHRADALASDEVAGILVQRKTGWHGLARIHELAVEGMSFKRVHEPRAAWQLELDDHPGKELALLITGVQTSGDEPERFAHLVVCRVSPEPSCRRIELSELETLELLADGSFVADAGEPRSFDSLDRADQPLIATSEGGATTASKGSDARCKVRSGAEAQDGRCKFQPEGDNGSFTIEPPAGQSFAGASVLTVSILEPGRAEVHGLTADGINSRWGEARRSSTDRACWDGEGFSVCVYAD